MLNPPSKESASGAIFEAIFLWLDAPTQKKLARCYKKQGKNSQQFYQAPSR